MRAVVAGTSKGVVVPMLDAIVTDGDIVKDVVLIVIRVTLEVPESSKVPDRKEKTSTTA